MIKFTATAIVHSISQVIQVSEKFQKRELILDDSWDKDGKHYPNFVLIEFSGDKMAQLDNFYPGQRVTVEGMLTGREYNNRIYNTIKGQSVTPYQQQGQYVPQALAPMPGAYPPQQQYQSAPGYQAAPMPGTYQPQQPYAPTPMPTAPTAPVQQQYHQASGPGVADLPPGVVYPN